MNTTLPAALRPHFRRELDSARNELDAGNYLASWRHLERAHILGQPYPVAHTVVHLRMLAFGIRLKKPPRNRRPDPATDLRWSEILRRSHSGRQHRRRRCPGAALHANS